MSVRARAVVEVERSILRDVNDRVHEVLLRLGTDDSQGQYICECGCRGCIATVELDAGEYELIRSSGGVVSAPGHDR